MYKSSQPATELKPARTKGQETKERIVRLALEYFNRHGIEYVGIRELARELGLSPGNLSYYFPTKEDLIMELSRRLSAENSMLFAEVENDPSITSFLDLFKKAFQNHYKYRCLFVSFVHTMKHNPLISERYTETQKLRLSSLSKDLHSLIEHGYLRKDLGSSEVNRIIGTISHIARFWIQEAEVLYSSLAIEKIMNHYVGLIAGTLEPYSTKKGGKLLEPYLKEVFKLV